MTMCNASWEKSAQSHENELTAFTQFFSTAPLPDRMQVSWENVICSFKFAHHKYEIDHHPSPVVSYM